MSYHKAGDKAFINPREYLDGNKLYVPVTIDFVKILAGQPCLYLVSSDSDTILIEEYELRETEHESLRFGVNMVRRLIAHRDSYGRHGRANAYRALLSENGVEIDSTD